MRSEKCQLILLRYQRRTVSAEKSGQTLWFDDGRIPPGKWPFLSTTYAGLRQLEESLAGSIDLTEGNDAITITGCLEAYRQAILRRTLDLTQAVVASWNAGQLVGSVVCARAVLETLTTFHSLLSRAHNRNRFLCAYAPYPSEPKSSQTSATRQLLFHESATPPGARSNSS